MSDTKTIGKGYKAVLVLYVRKCDCDADDYMNDSETMEEGYKAVVVLYMQLCGPGVKCVTAAIWLELADPFPSILCYNLAMEFQRVPPPMRWQLCAHCNEIIYVIVSPDECPKCGNPMIIRSFSNLQSTRRTEPKFHQTSMLRPTSNLHVAKPSIAKPERPKPLFELMLERDIASMIRETVGTDNCIAGQDKNQEPKWRTAHRKNRSWTAEEWKQWRREQGYRAWTGQISAEYASK